MTQITNPMHPHNVLSRARQLIQAPEHWIKGSFSRDAGGKTVNSWESSACYFCLVGAVRHAAFEATGHNSMWDATMQSATVRLTNALRRRHALTGGLSDLSLSAWNDAQARQHGEVLELLDHAIAKEAAS